MNAASDQDYEDVTEHLELSTQDAREKLRNKNLLNDAARFTTKYIDKQYREARRSFESSNSRSNARYHQPDVSRRFSNTSRERTPSSERISYCVVQRSPDGNPLTKHCCSWKEKCLLEGDQTVNIVQNTRRDVTYNYSQDARVKYKPDDNDTSSKQATEDRRGNSIENINHDTFSTPLQSLENKSLDELLTARKSAHCDDIDAETARLAQHHHRSAGQRTKTLQRTVLERGPLGKVTCTCVCKEPALSIPQAANECSYKMDGPMCSHIKDRMRYYNQLPESEIVELSQNGVQSEISSPTVTVSLNDIGKPSKPVQPSENSIQPPVEVKNRLLSPPPYSATDPAVEELQINFSNQPKVDQMKRSVGIYGSPVDASLMGIPMDFSLRGSPVDFSHLGTAVDSGLRAGALSRPKTTMKKPKRQQSRGKTFLYSSKSKDFQNGEIKEDQLSYSKSSSAIPSGIKPDSWECDPTIALLSNIPSATRSRPTFAKNYQKTRSPLSSLPDKISLSTKSGSKVDVFAQDLSMSDDSIEDEQVATVQKAMETVYRSSFSNDILRNFYGVEPSDTPSISSNVNLPEPDVLPKLKPAFSKEPQVFDLQSPNNQQEVESEQVTDVPINGAEGLEKTKETEGDFTDVQKQSSTDLNILDDLRADEKSEHFFSSVNVAPQTISDHSAYVDADNNAAFESQNLSTQQPPPDDTVTDDINESEFHDADETIAEVKLVKTFAEHLESMNQELLKVLSPAEASANQPVDGVEDRHQIKSMKTPLTKPSIVDCKVSAIPGYYQLESKSDDIAESMKLNEQKCENVPRDFDMRHPTLETDVKNNNTTSPPEKSVKFLNERVAADAIPSNSNASKTATQPFTATIGETSAGYVSTDDIPSNSPSVYTSSPDRHSVVSSSFGDLNSPPQRLAGTESHLTWDYTLSGDNELNVSMIPLIGSSNIVKPLLAESSKTMEGSVQKVELQSNPNKPTTLLIVQPMKALNDAFASQPLLETPSKITKDQVCQVTITDSSYPGSSDVDTTLVSPFKQFNMAPKPSSKPEQKLYKTEEKDVLRLPPQNVNFHSSHSDNDCSVHLNSYNIDTDITEQIENLKKATECSSREPAIPPENQLQKDLDNTLTNNDIVSAINTSDLGQVILPRRYSHVSTSSLTDIDITYFPSSTTTSNGNSPQPTLGKNKQDAATLASTTPSTQLSPHKPHRTISQPIKLQSTQRISNQITQFPSNTTAAVLSSPTGQDINLQVNDVPQLNHQSTQYSSDVHEKHQKPVKNLTKTSRAAQERPKIRSSSAIGRIKSTCSATNKKKKNLNSYEYPHSPHKLHSSNCEADRMAHESASDASSAESERKFQRSREQQKSKSKVNQSSTPFLVTKNKEYSKKSALRSSKSKSQHRQVTIDDGKKSVKRRSRTHNIRRVVSTESQLPTDSELESGAALPLDRLERPLQQNAGIQTRYTGGSSEGSAYSDDETTRNQRGTSSPLSGRHSASSDDRAIHTDITARVTTSDISQKVEGEEEWSSAGQIDKLLAINNHMKDLLNTLEVERDAHHNNRASSSSDNSNSISLGTIKPNKSLEDSIIASLVNKIGAKMNAIAGRLERKGEYPKAEAIGEANVLYQNLAGLINKTRSGNVERLDYSQKELGQLLTTVACSLLSLCVYLKQPNSLPPPSSTTHRLKDEVTDTESLTSLPEIPPKNIISKPHIYQLPGPELDLQMDSKPKEKSTRTKTQNRLYGLNEANRVLASKYSTEFPSSRRQAKTKLPTKGSSKASLLKSVRRNQSILKASINKGGLTIQYSKQERSKPASSDLQNTYGVATLPSRRSRMKTVAAERNTTQSKQNKTYVSGKTDHSQSILKDRKISQSEPKFRTKSSSLRKPSLDQY